MTSFNLAYDDCMKMVKGMKRMPDSPARFLVYCCEDASVCIKMNDREMILYYGVREEFVGREDLLPVSFENELTFNIK